MNQVRADALVRKIATIAVLAIVLGLILEVAIVVVRSAYHGTTTSVVAETAGTLSWSVIVCFGVAAGTTIVKAEAVTAGIVAFFFAPLALAAAKAVQKGISVVLGQPSDKVTAALFLLAAIKAVQYGLLAFVLAKLTRRKFDSLRPYLLVGVAVGLTFGSLLTAVAIWTANPSLSLAQRVTTGVNEILFPLGCVIAIFAARSVARFAEQKAASESDPAVSR